MTAQGIVWANCADLKKTRPPDAAADMWSETERGYKARYSRSRWGHMKHTNKVAPHCSQLRSLRTFVGTSMHTRCILHRLMFLDRCQVSLSYPSNSYFTPGDLLRVETRLARGQPSKLEIQSACEEIWRIRTLSEKKPTSRSALDNFSLLFIV
jgi:hypothetical protein